MELQGQVAIVTGAGRGIGRATALELARMGADIVVAELDAGGRRASTAAEVKALGRRARRRRAPTSPSAPTCAAMAERTQRRVRPHRHPREQRRHLPRGAAARRHRGALGRDHEHQRQGGVLRHPGGAAGDDRAEARRIVSLASMAGKVGSRTNLPYNASKAAVISMTKSLALAHAADGIRVNCVCPGFVETDMWTKVAREQGALLGLTPRSSPASAPAPVPLGRMETPGGRRQRDRLPRLAARRLHDGPGAERRRRPRHARIGAPRCTTS